MTTHARGSGERPRNSFHCLPFSQEVLEQQVRSLSKGARTSHSLYQVEYLGQFLEALGAMSLLVESHYIDRHFVEEFSSYYSRSLLSTGNSCARIHVFRGLEGGARLDEPGVLDGMLHRAASGEWEVVNESMRAAYLGFIVVRPLPSVPIGRTVLVPPTDTKGSSHWFGVRYTIHTLGFELPLEGVAFQQQDRAVGACATAAIWMALQRTCKNEGDRPPTPSAVSEAAVRYFLPSGRSLPSSGLTVEQICEALRYFEFPPEVLTARGLAEWELEYFRMRLHVYLRSGMPVILAVNTAGGGHAVTIVGYKSETPRRICLDQVSAQLRRCGSLADEMEEPGNEEVLRLMNLDYDHVYIHDDRLGPYILARLDTELSPEGKNTLKLRLMQPGGEEIEAVEVLWAAVPLYPKLRSAAHELFESSVGLLPLIRELSVQQPEDDLAVEFFFARSGHYLTDLYRQNLDPDRLGGFLKEAALSRYVGVVRWFLNGKPLLDTIWDTTDRMRETRYEEHLLGMISFRQEDWVDQVGESLDAPVG